jgi:hypothetical protein
MSTLCSCTSSYNNTGLPNCIGELIKDSQKLIMVSRYNNAGTLNKIPAGTLLNQAFFDALVVNVDRSVRLYPLPKHVNAEIAKEASVFETFTDGSKQFIHEGVSNFKCTYAGKQPSFLSILKSGRCTDMAVYIVDKNGALVGLSNGEADVLYPFALNKNTTDAIYKWATASTGSNIEYMFEFDTNQKDEEIVKIDSADMVSVNLLNLQGLIDAKVKYTSTGQTSMVVKLFAVGGSVATPVAIQGLLAANFALYNVTTPGAITIATAVESTVTPGTYTLTWVASQTIGNVIRLTPTYAKYDFTEVIATTSVVV